MDTINTVELKDENIYPDEQVLKSVLGDTYSSYEKLLDLYSTLDLNTEWRYYNDGKAWLCKVQKKKKTIVWMSAWKGYMQASIYLPLRLLDLALELNLSDEQKQKIRDTKNVGKSKPCIFEIRNDEIIDELALLMEYKIKSK